MGTENYDDAAACPGKKTAPILDIITRARRRP